MYVLKEDITFKEQVRHAIEKCKNFKNGRILCYTFSFHLKDLLPLLSHPADKDSYRIYWQQSQPNITLAGLNIIANLEINDYKNFNDFNNEIKKILSETISITSYKGIGPRFIGGHSFAEDSKSDSIWNNFTRGRYILPECLATKTDDGSWLTISRKISYSDNCNEVLNEFSQICSHYTNRLPVTLPPIKYNSINHFNDIPSKEEYNKMILSILKKIKPGVLDKVVLSRSHKVKIDKNFSIISALQVLINNYPKCTNFFMSFPGEGIFLGSTPERLIKKSNHSIITEALAGTIARGRNMEEDRLLEKKLFNSHKEREEHKHVIDQIIKRLTPYTSEVEFSNSPHILKLKNVQHLQTIITSNSMSNLNIFDFVNILHPTSATAGTPMAKALDIIKLFEIHDRGWYSGPVGWIDQNNNGDIFVALRSALIKSDEAHVFSGGGIVAESLPEEEWEETELKLQPILSALSGGQV